MRFVYCDSAGNQAEFTAPGADAALQWARGAQDTTGAGEARVSRVADSAPTIPTIRVTPGGFAGFVVSECDDDSHPGRRPTP
jgi:hypothetical protein